MSPQQSIGLGVVILVAAIAVSAAAVSVIFHAVVLDHRGSQLTLLIFVAGVFLAAILASLGVFG